MRIEQGELVGSSDDVRRSWADRGVSFFDTYIGAASLAFEHELIGSEGLGRVIERAFKDLESLGLPEPIRERHLLAHARDRDACTLGR